MVEKFLGKKVYTLPCGSVRKGKDPHGRIVHDFSFAQKGGKSINSVLIENSVEYIAFKERVKALCQVS